MSLSTYQLISFDPDLRKNPDRSVFSGLCVCCGRKIKNDASSVPVSVDWYNFKLIVGHDKNFGLINAQNGYIGKKCLQKTEY